MMVKNIVQFEITMITDIPSPPVTMAMGHACIPSYNTDCGYNSTDHCAGEMNLM
jgi:hypothetical protein